MKPTKFALNVKNMFAENVQWTHLYVKNAMNYELKILLFAFVIEMLNILFCLL